MGEDRLTKSGCSEFWIWEYMKKLAKPLANLQESELKWETIMLLFTAATDRYVRCFSTLVYLIVLVYYIFSFLYCNFFWHDYIYKSSVKENAFTVYIYFLVIVIIVSVLNYCRKSFWYSEYTGCWKQAPLCPKHQAHFCFWMPSNTSSLWPTLSLWTYPFPA